MKFKFINIAILTSLLIFKGLVFSQTNSTRGIRLTDSLNSDILFLSLGNPNLSTIREADFDLNNDRVLKNDKIIFSNYFKQNLGVKYFVPIDKTIFKVPATGWCSWYHYYQDLDMDEALLNTRWLAKNFKNYGLKYIQIDDAWQDTGTGDRDNRDWTNINKRFSKFGMDSLAMVIKQNGFTPALWIVPHGQSNLKVAQKSGAFMLDKKGKSTIKSNWLWVGDYQIDPTSKNVLPYFKSIHKQFKNYDYLKIDGQSLLLPDYIKSQSAFGKPKENAIFAYRNTLKALRESVGNETFLLGCWRQPLEGIGFFNGSRSNGDIWANIAGFGSVLEAIRAGYFLHNTAWYVDPDPVMVGAPLSLDMAKVWASTIGLTGMSTFITEKMPDLAPSRINILKKVFPAQDVHPVDLFRYSKNKTIMDLKIEGKSGIYDVVGVFNYEAQQKSTTLLDWEKLGLQKDSYYHVYNFWEEEYVGCFNYGVFVNLAPASCKVFSIVKATDKPQLISTNRHITQGVDDILLAKIMVTKNEIKYVGKSKIIANDEYKIVFGTPLGTNGYKIIKVTFDNQEGKFFNAKGCSYASFTPKNSGETNWEVTFEPIKNILSPIKGEFKEALKLTNIGQNKIKLNFEKSYGINFGYLVKKNDKPLGYAIESPILLNKNNSDVGSTYSATETYSNFITTNTRYSIKDTLKTSQLNYVLTNTDEIGNVCYEPFTSSFFKNQKGSISFYGNGTKSFLIAGEFSMLNTKIKINSVGMHYLPNASFEILGDGVILYKSKLLSLKDNELAISIPIKKIKEISFKVVFEQAGSDWASILFNDIELVDNK